MREARYPVRNIVYLVDHFSERVRVTRRTPTALRVLTGNPQHRPFASTPKPLPIAPTCPRWMPTLGKAEWKRVIPELEEMGLIGRVDGAVLEAYCLSYARWRQAEAMLTRDGLVTRGRRNVKRKHPAALGARDYEAAMLRLVRELGLTPASRQGMDTAPVDDDDPEGILD